MSTTEERRAQHQGINNLSHYSVAKIVRQYFPKLPAKKLNQTAKLVVAAAHEIISSKTKV